MARFLYNLLLYVLLPLLLLRQAWRARGLPVARGALAARLGRVDPVDGRPVWVHCVSVGETVAAEPLIAALRARGERLLVTSTTFTGAARVQARLAGQVEHRYMPFDTPGAVRRFLDRVQPRLLLVMETELWPNLLRACRRRGIPVLLVNARLSARSARGYARFAALTRPMLADLTCIAAQGEADAQRFLALGMAADRVRVTGNLKFDVESDAVQAPDVTALRAHLQGRPAWIAASTHAGEDEIVLAAHRRLLRDFPEALLVLVPRHPERFAAVAALAERSGLGVARRSEGGVPTPAQAVFLGDTMGEMPVYYALADVAFLGGSLVPVGGHNFLEPAAMGLPLLSGLHCFNFQAITEDLVAAGALVLARDDEALAQEVSRWLLNPAMCEAAGSAARHYVERNRGAVQRLLALVDEVRGEYAASTRKPADA